MANPFDRPRSRPRGLDITLAVLLLLAAAGRAHADCAPDPDTDGDGICDPVDNCVTVPNADQLDTYGLSSGDGSGDACEAKAEARINKVKIRGGPVSASPKGKITIKGYFILLAAETFNPPSIAGRVVDGIQLDQSTPVPAGAPAVCALSASGKNIKCKQAAPQTAVQTSATFKLSSTSSGAPRVVQFSVKIAKLAIGGQAFSEPVTVTVTDSGTGIERVGVIHDCSASNGQLTCREL
jgi:hypothetical protein